MSKVRVRPTDTAAEFELLDGSGSIWVDIVEITPEIAAHWEESGGDRNFRGITPQRLAEYRESMKNSKWRFTGATIVFRSDGTLVDGQKRLRACVESGVTFVSLVVWGVDEEDAHDIGEKRTLNQHLSKKGEKYAHNLVASLRLLNRIILGIEGQSERRQESYTVMRRLLELHPGIRESSERMAPLCSSRAGPSRQGRRCERVNHPIATVMHYQATRNGYGDEATLFFEQFARGLEANAHMLDPQDPILALNRLLRGHSQGNSRLASADKLAYTVLAWNAWINGRKLKALRWVSVGPLAMRFPKQEFPPRERVPPLDGTAERP